MRHSYHAFDLILRSEVPFPELVEGNSVRDGDERCVTVSLGGVSRKGISSPTCQGAFYQSTEKEWWMSVPKVGRFLVTDGKRILVDPAPGSDAESLRAFLLSSCLAAVLKQRGYFLLRASAIQYGNEAVGFAGLTGTGKSTLSAVFIQRGYSFLTDGICAVDSQGRVIPSFPQLTLWRDSTKYLEMEVKSLSKLRPGLERYVLALGERFHATPLPLRKLYFLSVYNKPGIDFAPAEGMEKLRPVENHVYGKLYFPKMRNHFLRCAQIAQVPMVHIKRTLGVFHARPIADMIENDLRGGSYVQ